MPGSSMSLEWTEPPTKSTQADRLAEFQHLLKQGESGWQAMVGAGWQEPSSLRDALSQAGLAHVWEQARHDILGIPLDLNPPPFTHEEAERIFGASLDSEAPHPLD